MVALVESLAGPAEADAPAQLENRPPYRGLDFYQELDAPLLREREQDTKNCVRLLSGYNLKFLLLQGSSGAGKSSFLRAGLIPALKEGRWRRPTPATQAVFLNVDQGVIRCTSDPLNALATAILTAFSREDIFVFGLTNDDRSSTFSQVVRQRLVTDITKAQDAIHGGGTADGAEKAYAHLGDKLIEALAELCLSVDGKLYLILDQTEEALTRTTNTPGELPNTRGFFRFLDEVYVRNLSMRVILSVRTEFYGRFRDALQIADDRLGERPSEGGIQPYLLRPIMNRDALIKAFAFPTKMKTRSGERAYPFEFDSGLLEEIVDNVLDWSVKGKASVTPLISMACAFLYNQLPDRKGTILASSYPGIERIVGDYFVRGMKQIGGALTNRGRWLELLHDTLVSRQGGGTVVSLTEDIDTFVHNANKLKLRHPDVRVALHDLAGGEAPLLRGEPADNPKNFSLKHDALAVTIERQHVAYEDRREQAWKFRILVACVLMVAAFGVGAGSLYKQHNDQQLRAEQEKYNSLKLSSAAAAATSSDIRVNYASRAVAKDPGESLRLLIASVVQNAIEPDDTGGIFHFIGKFSKDGFVWAGDTAEVNRKYRQAIDSLRRTLSRVPWMTSRFDAVGFDPIGKQLVVLRASSKNATDSAQLSGSELTIISLKDRDDVDASSLTNIPWKQRYPLPPDWRRQPTGGMLQIPAVGFLRTVGPAAYFGGNLYYWDRPNTPAAKVDLRVNEEVKALFGSFSPFAEFSGGSLILRKFATKDSPAQALRVEVAKSAGGEGSVHAVKLNLSLDAGTQNYLPFILLADSTDQTYFGSLLSSSLDNPIQCHILKPEQDGADCQLPILSSSPSAENATPEDTAAFTKLTLYLGDSSGATARAKAIGRIQNARIPLYSTSFAAPFPLALVSGGRQLALMIDSSVSIVDLDGGDASKTSLAITGSGDREFVQQVSKQQSLQPATSPLGWIGPLFAVSHFENGWIMAWNATNGMWIAATSQEHPEQAAALLGGTLLSGEAGGILLKFTADGTQLVLVQQPRFGSVIVRVWDLRKQWLYWLQNGASDKELLALACAILQGPHRTQKDQAELTDYELSTFKVDEAWRKPCEHLP